MKIIPDGLCEEAEIQIHVESEFFCALGGREVQEGDRRWNR